MPGTCHVIGEIDVVTKAALRTDLRDTIERSDTELVVVDCSGVTFMDSRGYHALQEATAYASRHGHLLVIRHTPPMAARVLRICDLDKKLHWATHEGLT